ncbi:MAG: sigma-54-dependent Fis family transcriptional regulator [Deltaproteobacteria bacterium]|nr:sigma-54-dependent Fis family transcriptional regulator [Deltaproteobacteria bacterium]
MSKVLIVDDESDIRYILSELLRKKGFSTLEASDGPSAIAAFRKERPHAVLLDHKMPGMDGFTVFLEFKKIDPSVPVIFLTAYGDIPFAVEAIKTGAYDFITKPPDIDSLALILKRGIEKFTLEQEVKRLNNAVGASVEGVFGKSGSIKRLIGQLTQVAVSDFSIIIQGETGTGKSTVAEIIHNMSKRVGGPFTRVDISVIPETLVESELFGYERGAFTGADRSKRGYFDVTNNGTIFIDELENMSPNVQSKLLSAVEQKKIYPMGGTKPVPADVRIISATNTDLLKLVREKRFREDLFFRLNEFAINIPPLRERAEDISFLARRFCKEACLELNKKTMEVSDEAIKVLERYGWPGNVRELKNAVRRAVLLSADRAILPGHIEFLTGRNNDFKDMPLLPLKEAAAIAVRDAESAAIRHALSLTGGNKSKAAVMLDVDYKTLLTKIKQYSIAAVEKQPEGITHDGPPG